jgi:hypothetical protein
MLIPSLQLLVYSLGILLVLGAVGLALSITLRTHLLWFRPVPPPLVGLAFVQVLSWNVSSLFDSGLRQPMKLGLVGLGLFLVLGFCGLLADWKDCRRSFLQAWASVPLISIFGSLAISILQWRHSLGSGYLTAASGNGDVASYALVTDHLWSHGFSSVGRLLGTDLGLAGKTDVNGAFSFLAFSRSLLPGTPNQMMLPALVAAMSCLAWSLVSLLQITTSLDRRLIQFVSLIPQTVFMMFYIAGNYFLSQILGTAFIISMVSVSIAPGTSESSFWILTRRNSSLLFLSAGMLLSYPHMLFISLPLLLCLSIAPRPKLSSILHPVTIFGMISLSIFLIPGRFSVALERLRSLAGNTVSGWPLPGTVPTQWMGLQTSETSSASNLEVGLSLLFLTMVLIGGVKNFRSHEFRLPILRLLLFVVCTYAYVYFVSGESYRQWKWITFFQPLFVVASVAALTILLLKKTGHYFLSAATVACVGLCCMNIASSTNYGRQLSTLGVSAGLAKINQDPNIRGLSAINIKAGPFLSSMWPAALVDKRTSILDPSYYTSSEALQAPTLVKQDFPLLDSVERSLVESGYTLVQYPAGQVSVRKKGLNATLSLQGTLGEFKVGTPQTVSVSVTNVGRRTWLGSGSLKGGVNLAFRIRKTEGSQIVELARASLTDFPNYISPGVTLVGTASLTVALAGDYDLLIEPVAEGVTWFGDVDSSSRLVIPISVSD